MVKDILKVLCNVFTLNLHVADPVLRAPSYMTRLSAAPSFKVSMLRHKNQKGMMIIAHPPPAMPL